jgi:NaMN:DMB phosphoribosyltransferase
VLNLTGRWTDPRAADDAVDALVDALADTGVGQVVFVSPEVGMSVVPATESGRTFADALGRLNRLVAQRCERVALVVAGQPTWLKGGPDGPDGLTTPGPRLATSAPRHAIGDDRVPASALGAPAISLGAVAAGGLAAPRGVDDGGGQPVWSNRDLPLPDETSSAAAAVHLQSLDFAGAGLGALRDIVSLAGGAQRRAIPRPWDQVRVLLLHALHGGGAAAGDDEAAAARHFAQAHAGTGAIALLAASAGVSAGTVGCPPAAAMEETDALTPAEVDDSLAMGWQLADAAADEGTDALVLAALGVGSEAAAVAVTVLTAGGEPAALLDRVVTAHGYVDDIAWMARCTAVRDALHRVRARSRDPRTILAAVGGGDLAVATGIILGAAYRRLPVLIDGPVGVAAGLMARDLAAQSRHWLVLPDHGGHPLVRFVGDVLGVSPVLHLRLRLGEGATSLAALPLLRAALTLAAGTPAAPTPGPAEQRWESADFPTAELPIVTRE